MAQKVRNIIPIDLKLRSLNAIEPTHTFERARSRGGGGGGWGQREGGGGREAKGRRRVGRGAESVRNCGLCLLKAEFCQSFLLAQLFAVMGFRSEGALSCVYNNDRPSADHCHGLLSFAPGRALAS